MIRVDATVKVVQLRHSSMLIVIRARKSVSLQFKLRKYYLTAIWSSVSSYALECLEIILYYR